MILGEAFEWKSPSVGRLCVVDLFDLVCITISERLLHLIYIKLLVFNDVISNVFFAHSTGKLHYFKIKSSSKLVEMFAP